MRACVCVCVCLCACVGEGMKGEGVLGYWACLVFIFHLSLGLSQPLGVRFCLISSKCAMVLGLRPSLTLVVTDPPVCAFTIPWRSSRTLNRTLSQTQCVSSKDTLPSQSVSNEQNGSHAMHLISAMHQVTIIV